MPDETFAFDVFLSYSPRDKETVRELAERLRKDGLRVWFDEWELRPNEDNQAQIEAGLQQSRVLVLCMSKHAYNSGWATLESQTYRFRDPANPERRFLRLRLDNTPLPDSLAQIPHLDWRPATREAEYPRLREASGDPPPPEPAAPVRTKHAEKSLQLEAGNRIYKWAFHPDGQRALSGGDDGTVRLWDLESGRCLRVLKGHTRRVSTVVWSSDGRRVLSNSPDGAVRLWDLESGLCLCVLDCYTHSVVSVGWSPDGRRVLSYSGDNTVRLWDLKTGRCLWFRVLEGYIGSVGAVAWRPDGRCALAGGFDGIVRLWDLNTGRCLRVLEGHSDLIRSVAWSPDGRRALSGADNTVRLWNLETGRCLRVLEGHTSWVQCVAWSPDGRHALSGGNDRTVRLWDVETGKCLRALRGHTANVWNVAWSSDEQRALSGDEKGGIRIWDLSDLAAQPPTKPSTASMAETGQLQYTNAKVLLVGETGAGKTGLSRVLAGEPWQPSDSTVGAWATQWKLPVASDDAVEREIWLWDFGGQADQRLIHQLYMDETALAVLVFDGQKDDLLQTLGQWDRDLTRASRQEFVRLLVAGRVDAGGLRVSRTQVEAFVRERRYGGYLETSAKQDIGCAELRQAIEAAIPWNELPCRTTLVLFKRLKDEIVRLKDEGRVLLRFNELRELLQMRLSGEENRFTDDELRTVLTLLSGPGVVWVLEFGSWVLLQPERINAYAQAVIQTLRSDEHERGCLLEERVLNGDLVYHSSMRQLPPDEERIVLLAMHETLVKRGLCLREPSEHGTLLIFPSYYRRERPELVGHPAVLVSYRFTGFLDELYATLVVRLHHTRPFQQDQLWRYAADFKTRKGHQLGIKLTHRGEGHGELEVYFDPGIAMEERILFSEYVHEHLQKNARDVVRLRHYVCPHCGTPVRDLETPMQKLAEGKKDLYCIKCDDPAKRIPLWDELEELFASPDIRQQVRELDEQARIVLDSESKDRLLVGEVISTVALANQIAREKTVSDHGIDLEIEFKNDAGEATGKMVLLQLKSGDSHLTLRKGDGAEIFRIPKERHAQYWMAQAFPVILVIRSSTGEVRWMEVRDYLRRATQNGEQPIRQFPFEGHRFDVMTIRRWRDQALATPNP